MSPVTNPREWAVGAAPAIGFALLSTYYSLVTPIFEAPDEPWHYLVVADLARGRFADPSGPARQEATQPPLYYVLDAVLWRLAPAPPPHEVLQLNPYFNPGIVNGRNLNFAYHGEAWERFPFAGLARTVHLLRLLSVALGALTVLGVYALGRTIAPARPTVAVLAAGFCGLLPQFLFLSGTINNDLAIIAASIWTLVLLTRYALPHPCPLANSVGEGDVETLRSPSPAGRGVPLGPGRERGSGGEALLVLALGLALLSKATAFGLLLLAAFVLLRGNGRGESLRRRIRRAAAVLGGALAIGGWWYLRLWIVDRDPLGTATRGVAALALGGAALASAVALPVAVVPPAYAPALTRLLVSLPASARPLDLAFGDQVELVGFDLTDDWGHRSRARLYWRRGPHPTAELSTFVHVVDATGRVVASADAGLAPGLILAEWPLDRVVAVDLPLRLPPQPDPDASAAAQTFQFDLGVYALRDGTICPVHPGATDAESVTLAAVQPEAHPRLPAAPAVARFGAAPGDVIDLLGWRVDSTAAAPGSAISGRLLWSAGMVSRTRYTVFVHLMRDGKLVAQQDAPPVDGAFPTTDWEPRHLVRDDFSVRLPDSLAPEPDELVPGWYDRDTLRRLPVGSADSLDLTTIEIQK